MSNNSLSIGIYKGVDEWLTLGTPVPMVSIVFAYIVFVYWWGPKFMAHRKSFDLKPFLILYNGGQVIWAVYVLLLPLRLTRLHTALGNLCITSKTPQAPSNYEVALLLWCFYISKVIDLIDTIFFVLRKKNNQISFLHVWHHAIMIPSSWVFLKYLQEPPFLPLCLLNTGVHAIMYTYYFISALGPQYAKYIWWKKYMTWIQMIQFVIIIVYLATLWSFGCHISKFMAAYIIINTFVLFLLFGNFYYKSYTKKGKVQ